MGGRVCGKERRKEGKKADLQGGRKKGKNEGLTDT